MACRGLLLNSYVLVIAYFLIPAIAKPIVDPGLFVIQGVTSCINGTGYCMLGSNCSVDVDFLPDSNGGHCRGLREAFTPKIDFVCCKYNPLGKVSSTPPTTTVNSYTITDVFSIIDEAVNNQEEEIPEDFNPENVIDIVGVVTDVTGIIGLVTRPWTGTFPTRATTPTTTPMTPSTSPTTVAPVKPATPVDVDQIVEEVTEESGTELATEPTESYNEIPTEVESDNQLEDQTTLFVEQQITSTVAATQTSSAESLSVTSLTSPSPIDENAIIFPDNPLVSLFPPLETEALEAETESIIAANEILSINDVQAPASSTPGNTGEVSSSPGTQVGSEQEVPEANQVQETVSSSPVNVEQGSNSPEAQQGAEQDTQQDSRPVGDSSPEEDERISLPEKPDVSDDYDYFSSDYADQLLLQPINQNICGFKGYRNYISQVTSSRILGGVRASTVEWCWVAAIMERRRYGDKFVCSGALVESDLLVTTGTCLRRLQNRDLSKYIIVLGDSNLREDLPYGIQFHRITEIDIHPDYFTSGGAHVNDIGVVRLRDHATLSDNVCLVCMAQQDAVFPSQSCTVTGYGIGDVPKSMMKDVKEKVPLNGVLRQIAVPVLSRPTCMEELHNITGSETLAASDSFLCAGGQDGNNACYSTMDGGSPLACEAGGRWFLAGVVSWTRDCENSDVPNVYTRVSSFSNWLQATHLRMMGFLTDQVYSQQVRWIKERVDKINKEFS